MPSKTVSLTQAVETFLRSEQRSGKAPLTLLNYRADLTALLRSTGDRTVGSLSERAVKRHLEQLPVGSRSWNRHLTTLRRFCDFMVEQRVLQRNPLRGIERAAVSDVRSSPASAAQINAVIDQVDNPRDQALLAVLWECGLRIREALALHIGDVDLHLARLRVHLGMPRSVALSPNASRLLERYICARRSGSGEPLFTSYGTRQLSYAGAHRLFRRYAGTTGLTMRRLRASAAVAAFDRGDSLTQVQAMLGHQHAASTARYQADADTHEVQKTITPMAKRKTQRRT
ncbi:MAG: tyrosine-type recombinase/integrase [Candidatus Eremiobacteraeota bacterium]|nr:tyrosine-type recombinase/integrase [Candidatus Eremiobacteraeota bacterium]